MRKIYIVGVASVFAGIAAFPLTVNAQERTVTGAAIGAGAGALVAGPVGAVVGGGVGAVVGGPRLTHSRHCWRDDRGDRHCRRHY